MKLTADVWIQGVGKFEPLFSTIKELTEDERIPLDVRMEYAEKIKEVLGIRSPSKEAVKSLNILRGKSEQY